ncbi:MAG: type II toxin-antitoxin system RelE/ParE family toxin [Burkholderiales bacterium]|nr:type II toxin-antitoxin system RelE/ParE family toxin [Burkholderiales bacterium]
MSEADARSGKSPHAFMREALDAQARLRESRSALVRAALAAEARALASRTGYAAGEVERYFAGRAANVALPRPAPRAFGKVVYSDAALADMERICVELEADDPTLAGNSVALIAAAIRDLGTWPGLGRPAEEDLRERLVSRGRTGYVVLYRHLELDACVLIVAIRHRYAAGYPRAE